MDTVAIVNLRASSASRWGAEGVERLLGPLRPLEILYTGAKGEATAMAREAARRGATRLVAVGGDGTIGEVVTGVADRLDAVALGLVPGGTGNDLCHTLGIPLEPELAVEVIAAGRVRAIDAVQIRTRTHTRLLLNTSSGGFGALVGTRAQGKDVLGTLAYGISAGMALPELTPHHLELIIDGQRVAREAYGLVACNGRTVGGGVVVAPRGAPDDGWLDLLLIPVLPLAGLVQLAMAVLSDALEEVEGVELWRARRLEINATPPLALLADGEAVGNTPAVLDVLHRVVRVFAP